MNIRFQILMKWLLFLFGEFGGLLVIWLLWLQKILVYGLYGLVLVICQKLFEVNGVFLLLLMCMMCFFGMLIMLCYSVQVLLLVWQMVISRCLVGSFQIWVSSFQVQVIVFFLKQLLNDQLLSILKKVWWCVVQLIWLRLLCLLFVCRQCCMLVVCMQLCFFVLRNMFLNCIMLELVNSRVGLLFGISGVEGMMVWFLFLKNLRKLLWIWDVVNLVDVFIGGWQFVGWWIWIIGCVGQGCEGLLKI